MASDRKRRLCAIAPIADPSLVIFWKSFKDRYGIRSTIATSRMRWFR
jgi:hypothetical protein